MKKRLLAWVLSFVLALSLLPVGVLAAGVEETPTSGVTGENNTLTWNFDVDTGTLTISGEGRMFDYPSPADDVPWEPFEEETKTIVIEEGVTHIGSYAFSDGYNNVTKLIMPESVTSVGMYAFWTQWSDTFESIKTAGPLGSGCNYEFAWTEEIPPRAFELLENLADVDLPDSIKTIGDHAFWGCGLEEISLPEGLIAIEDSAFNGTNLAHVTVPNSVTELEGFAFAYCDSLESLTLLNPIEKLPEWLCAGCDSLQSVTIPSSVTSIGRRCFWDSGLTNIHIPEGIKTIESMAFAYSDLEAVTFPNTLEVIGDYAFTGCNNLTKVEFPKSVETISGSAFAECDSLQSVRLPDNLKTIVEGSFDRCENLKEIYIPSSVQRIERSVFSGCKNLSIYYGGTEAQWNAIDIDKIANDELFAATIHYNSIFPGDFSNTQYILAKFIGYDEATKQVSLETDSSVFKYWTTDQTDMSFANDLNALKGKYVLVQYLSGDYATDFSSRYVLSISSAVVAVGKLDAVTETSITINGKEYPMQLSDWANQSYLLQSSIGKFVVGYVLNNTVVDVRIPEEQTGTLESGTADVATIDGKQYMMLEEIPPYLPAPDLWFGKTVSFLAVGNIIFQMSLQPISDQYTKKLVSYDAASRDATFHDGSLFYISDGLTFDQALINRWVTFTVETSAGGKEITQIEVAKPEINVSFFMENDTVYLKENKYSFNGTDYRNSSDFRIWYSLSVSVGIPNASSADYELMQSDPSLAITIDDFSVTAPDGFHFGSGDVGDLQPGTIYPGHAYKASGFVQPDRTFSVSDDVSSLTKTINFMVDVSGGTCVEKSASFTIINQDYLEEEQEQIEDLSKEAADELGKLNVDSMIALNPNTMKEVFGLSDKDLELFREHMLVAIIMASASEDTFKDSIDQQVLKKVFEKYQPAVSASSKEIHLNYVFDTERYGTLNVEFTFGNLQVGLDGTVFSIFGAIDYTIKNAAHIPGDLKTGSIGQAQIHDVEAFGEAAYRVAEAEIKNAYKVGYGNSANQAAKCIFSQTILDILEADNKSFSDVIWEFATWSAKNFKNACPTDVFVYDKNGNLCGAIENNVITKEDPTNFTLRVEGDVKYILGLDDEYTVQYVATGDGTMEVEVTELLEMDVPLRTVTFHDIAITTGTTFTQESTPELLVDNTDYVITAETENGTTTTIEPDEDKIVLDFGTGEDPEQPEDPGTPEQPQQPEDPDTPEQPEQPEDPETPEQPAEPFTDVDETDWFYDEVVYVYANGLMDGVGGNRFAPDTATNRAMLATILYRLAGEPDVSGDLPFTDVETGTWYTDAVLWAAQNGIVNGVDEGIFAPMNTLTREQLVTMLYRYAEAEGYDVSAAADLSGYPDAGKVLSYAQKAMSWAVAEGIVAGMDDGTLNPAGNATRAQIATILMRFCEGVAQ